MGNNPFIPEDRDVLDAKEEDGLLAGVEVAQYKLPSVFTLSKQPEPSTHLLQGSALQEAWSATTMPEQRNRRITNREPIFAYITAKIRLLSILNLLYRELDQGLDSTETFIYYLVYT